MKNNKKIGLDIGGSHISASIIDLSTVGKQQLSLIRKEINPSDSAYNIITTVASCINKMLKSEPTINAVGIAFPGPFNYEKGVSAINNVGGKFEYTFGLHIAQALQDSIRVKDLIFRFSNDAHCFAAGAYRWLQLSSKRTVFLTLGTGFGSAFMQDAALIKNGPSLPTLGAFYNEPFLKAKADDYFSTRWFLNNYKQRTGKDILTVKELVDTASDVANIIFDEFGSNLGSFLIPWLNKFDCDELVIGGNISKAYLLFEPSLQLQLHSLNKAIKIVFCRDTEECILTGAAYIATQEKAHLNMENDIEFNRNSTQYLLPVMNTATSKNGYDIFPSFKSPHPLYKGFNELADKIKNEKVIIIDGYGGVLWELFKSQLNAAFLKNNKMAFWYDINTCLKPPEVINQIIANNLNGDDLVFGKKYTGNLTDFFDEQKLQMLQPDASIDVCIVYGSGASLSDWKGLLVYVDVPKNEIQYRMRAGSITNIGTNDLQPASQMYKRFYFVDWPVLNKHKEKLLCQINYIVDEQRINEITWMEGNDFRSTLHNMLEQPFRARPWFESGIWGGSWLKDNIAGLNKDEVNYAWSFELITPENGIVLQGNQFLLEVSFDFLLFYNNKKLLGNAALRFGNEFPIRFDFLDTYNGGNLSIQCHPRTKYIQDNFGENFTQDETYYILDCEADGNVYLGFQEDINADEFKTELTIAQKEGIEMDAEKYVQRHTAHKHDLFLIPNGTVHAAGKNNMILEISSTPYIYTFKMYDWQRLDLNGQPRPINIEHAFNNLYFDRKGKYVAEKLISKPVTLLEWDVGKQISLPTHEEHFYAVERYEFTGKVTINTNGQCHICMLVEGDKITVINNNNKQVFQYAETFVVPANVKSYELNYVGKKKAFVVVAYVR